ncbi:MAG TPA: hypothetical protein VNS55_14835 [Nocardioides sp.]|nr:hypothetical protein [Nocardioides sp.]
MGMQSESAVDAAVERQVIAALEARLAVLERQVRRRRGRRPARVAAFVAALAVVVGGVAWAGPSPRAATTDTTAVDFVPLPAHAVYSGTIGPGATVSVVVIGGATTVPTNARAVQMTVTAKGAADGTLTFSPAGNAAGGGGQQLPFTAGVLATSTVAENIGLRNQVSVTNSSAKGTAVTVKLVGYSEQVTAGDINGSGGDAGQVLTNDGNGGTTWSPVPATGISGAGGAGGQVLTNDGNGGATWGRVAATGISGSGGLVGQVLMNTGSGAGWVNLPSLAYGASPAGSQALPVNADTVVASQTVPGGAYVVLFSGSIQSATAADVACTIDSPGGNHAAVGYATASGGKGPTYAMQGLVRTAGGTVTVHCTALGAGATMNGASLTVVQVGAVGGRFATPRPQATWLSR